MIPAPDIVGSTVATAAALPVFVSGFLRLAVMPPNAPTGSVIQIQDPPAETMLDVGGTVTAIP